jgi:hypothetical protein
MSRRFQFSLRWSVIATAVATFIVAIYCGLAAMFQERGVRFGDTEEITSGPDDQNVRYRYFKPGRPNP